MLRRTVELLSPCRLVFHVDTFDVTLHLTNEKLCDGTLRFGALIGSGRE